MHKPLPLDVIDYPSSGGATKLLIAHGLFGSGRNWGVIAKRLSNRGSVCSVDMRNHGGSPWDANHSYPDLAADLHAVLTHESDLLGHSMGGKAAMVAALQNPSMIRRLIVADIAPIAYEHSQAHLIDAMCALDLDAIDSRRGADIALAQHVPDPSIRAFLLQSLDIKNRRWRLNLSALRANLPNILGWPEIHGRYDKPTLFITGQDSDYVSNAHRDKIRSLFPNATFVKIKSAGHWLHADQPRAFEATVRAFLDRTAD